jgi:predicted amidophosphoribosyltransferase
MKCKECKRKLSVNEKGQVYCNYCWKELTEVCKICGNQKEEEMEYCITCGNNQN